MVLRRTWPQRLVVVACVGVIVAAVLSARTVTVIDEVWEGVDREFIVDTGQYGHQLLRTDTEPGAPVNFLLVGTDSALGLDPDDPVMAGRVVDPTGRSLADALVLVRLDPVAGSAWVLSIPRDLWAEIPGAQDNRITSALYIGGAELLVATVTSMFDVEINHYIELDLAGFREVVDALGGIPVWFDHPARDSRSGLNIAEAGCHVLNGEQALQYVRSRRYTEMVDGRWRITGGDDFARIERQQDFMVLALDRAINRGARNPSTLLELLQASAGSMTLDQDLRLSELVALGEAYADFNPENLQRDRLQVYTLWWPDGSYQGEAAYRDLNRSLLEVFRGAADSLRPSEVSLTITGFHEVYRDDAATRLAGEGFNVLGSHPAPDIAETVVLHGPDQRAAALAVARYLEPVPYVVAHDDADGVVVALGADYGGVLYVFQEPLAQVREQVDDRGTPAVVPDPAGLVAPAPTAAPATAAPTTVAAAQPAALAGGPPAIMGRPPQGETCN